MLGVSELMTPVGLDQKMLGAGETPDTVQVRLNCEPTVMSPEPCMTEVP